MDTTLKLYFNDGSDDIGFPYNMQQAELLDFTVNKTRMSVASTITATLSYPICLDDEWDANCRYDEIFVTFNGEKYYLKATPSSSKSNDSPFYKHELTFVSERAVLETTYMIDDIENQTANIIYSNNTKIVFFGSIEEFAERINQSMYFSDIGDTCMYIGGELVPIEDRELNGDGFYVVVDSGVSADEALISLSNNTISEALKQVFEKFNVPYYFDGRVIHIGEFKAIVSTDYAVDGVLGAAVDSGSLVPYEYGNDDAALTVSRNNNTKQIYNRCSGTGSGDNIPYYYPNPTPSGTIHHETTARPGSTLDNTDITITDPLKFSNLGVNDAIVWVFRNESITSHVLVKNIYVNDQLYNGVGFHIQFPYDDFGAGGIEYYGVDVPIRVEFLIKEECGYFVLNFGSEFASPTNWQVRRPDGAIITGQGRWANINRTQLINGDGDFVTGLYKLYLSKPCEPENTSQQSGYFNLDGLMRDIYAEDPYLWFSVVSSSTRYWSLRSNGSAVNLEDYGIQLASGVTLRNGDLIQKIVDKWVVPQEKLMPSCYRLSDGRKKFYPAQNYPLSTDDYTPDTEIGDEVSGTTVNNYNYIESGGTHYNFKNTYRRLRQKEHIYDYQDTKPSIKEMTNSDGNRMDMFVQFAYDTNDDNSGYYDNNGNFVYNHPYFFALLRPTDGSNGFNLFDSAIDEQEMVVAFTSGHCAPCEFVIGVDKDTQKNLVQCTQGMVLLRDEEGNVRCGRDGMQQETPIDFQNDTSSGYTWIALKKDISTYGEAIPYNKDGVVVRPQACSTTDSNDGDTFVILHINLPQAYIEAAEEKLTKDIIKDMHGDNFEKFNVSLKYSRVYLGENQPLISILDENVKVLASYNDIEKQYFVSSYSYRMQSSSPIPEITISGLVETVEELKTVASTGGSFIQKIDNHIAENFDKIVLGFNKPFSRIINNNNNSVTNQIKGEFPTDYVRTKDELTSDNIVLGAGGNRVKKMLKNGTNGQILKIIDNIPVWSDPDEPISVSTKKLQTLTAIYNTYHAISALSFTVEESGMYLIVVQLNFAASNSAESGSKQVSAYISTDEGKTSYSSGEVDVDNVGQINLSAYIELEKEEVVNVYAKCATNNSVVASYSISGGLPNATILKAIKVG